MIKKPFLYDVLHIPYLLKARAVFPGLYKHLVRWLKTAGLGREHTMDTIMGQLTSAIRWGMSPHAFLAHYLQPPSVVQVRSFLFSLTNLT